MTFIVPFFLVFAILMIFLFYQVPSKWNWVKFIGGAVAIFLSTAIFFSFDSYKGWPADMKYTVYGSQILNITVNINPNDPNKGSIYVEALPCFTDDKVCTDNFPFLSKLFLQYTPSEELTPRLYEIPFTEETKKLFAEGQEAMQEGQTIFMKIGKKADGSEDGKQGENGGNGNGTADKNGSSGNSGMTRRAISVGDNQIILEMENKLNQLIKK